MDSMPIPVRVTPEEIKAMKRRAKAEKKTLANYVRGRLGLPEARIGRPAKKK